MAFTVQLGSVSITVNPTASATPVVVRPLTVSDVYNTFKETIVSSGLIKTIFDAFKVVVHRDDPELSANPWPPGYGTTEEPWGQPANPETGEREIPLVDIDGVALQWTNAINETAKYRKSMLDYQVDLSTAIATGIKAALESKFRAGRVTMPSAGGIPSSQWVTVNVPVNPESEIFLQAWGFEGELHSASLIEVHSSSFTIMGDGTDEIYFVSWMVVG